MCVLVNDIVDQPPFGRMHVCDGHSVTMMVPKDDDVPFDLGAETYVGCLVPRRLPGSPGSNNGVVVRQCEGRAGDVVDLGVHHAVRKPCVHTNVVDKTRRLTIVLGFIQYRKTDGSSPGGCHRVQNRGDEFDIGVLTGGQ